MAQKKVTNQSELDAAIAAGDEPVIVSNECFDISRTKTVECYDSSQPRVECYDLSQPRVVCYGTSQPRVECYDSSQPRVVCYGTSQPRVDAKGNAQLSVAGPVQVIAGNNNAVLTDGKATVSGGKIFTVLPILNGQDWCDTYGVPTKDGVAILFKAVGADFKSPRGGDYTPGSTRSAPDWDGGKQECGGGLHFSPRPSAALAFNIGAERFVACPVAVKDISVHPDARYPSKIKASGCCSPVWECTIDGEIVASQETAKAGIE